MADSSHSVMGFVQDGRDSDLHIPSEQGRLKVLKEKDKGKSVHSGTHYLLLRSPQLYSIFAGLGLLDSADLGRQLQEETPGSPASAFLYQEPKT